MAAKGYSAGAIFLQVVPVFANVQRAIEDEAKSIDRALGDQMEKSGEKAGERAGKAAAKGIEKEVEAASRRLSGSFEKDFHKSVDSINSALGQIDGKRMGNNLRRELAELKKEFAELKDVDLAVDVDRKRAEQSLAILEGRLLAMRDNAKVIFRADIDQALKGIAKIRAAREAISDPIEIEVRADTRQLTSFEKAFKKTAEKASGHLSGALRSDLVKIRKELESLGDAEIGVDLSAARARAELAGLMFELNAIAQSDTDIDVRLDAGRALAEMGAFEAALARLDAKDVEVTVKTDQAQRGLFGLGGSADDAANSFRSFNIWLLASAGAGPALVPVLAAIAGGLLAIGPAAAVAVAGLGSVLVGFSGIGNAVQALSQRQEQQAMTAQTAAKQQQTALYAVRDAQEALADAQRNAARAAEDAAERVADARESAADAIESALDRQREAQEAYRDSVDDVRDAERALAEARREAAGMGKDIEERMADNALAQDQALLDVFNATVTYDSTMADGSATNAEQEQARINLERARDTLDDLRKEQAELAKEKRQWDREGINGTEQVQSAQERLTDALEAQREAQEAVGDAAREVDEARRDGAEMVREAIEAQNETLADNARAIEDARRNLARARQASDDVAQSMTAQQNAVNNAMDALGPAGRKFALFLFGLRDEFRAFRDDVQQAMLPSIQDAIEGFMGSKNASIARGALVALAGGFGQFAEALSASFQGKAWRGFFEMLADLGPDIQAAYGRAFIAFLEGMASMLTTLAPYALDFAKGFERMMEAFAAWAASPEGRDELTGFMDHVREIAPAVLDFFGAFFSALTNVMIALAPYGEFVLGLLTSFLDFVAGLDPKVLGIFLTALLALITSAQLAYAAMNLLRAGSALLGNAFGRTVFFALALGLMFGFLWTQGGTLGKVITVLGVSIIGVVYAMKLWRAITALVAAIQVGLTAATYGAAGATYAQAGAARFAYLAARLWAGAQWLVVAAMNGTLLSIIRTNVAVAIAIARTYAQAAASKAVAVGLRAWAAAQFLLNAAMRMNPLGIALTAILAIAAGMVWAYKKFDGFRKVVDTVVNAVADAFFWLWDFLFGHSVMPDIIDGMEWFFDKLSAIFGWIKTKVVEPLARAFEWLWTNVIKPVLGFIIAYYKAVFKAMKWAWTNVLWPVFKTIFKVVWTLWKAYFKVVFTLIKAIVKGVFMAISWVWKNVLKPVFDAIGKIVGWLWDKIVKPYFTWIGDKFEDVFRGMKWVWDNVLKPVFNYIGDKALPKLKGAFETAVDAIKDIWDGLKRVIGTPIKFVLDTIINKGLIAGFNKVAGWVDMDGFDEIPIPTALQSYATGGVLPGYTPGRDPHKFYSPTGGRLELSGGEAIMRPEFTAAVGSDFVHTMNAAARNGGIDGVRRLLGGGGQRFARGGVFFPVPEGWYINRSQYNLTHDGVDINHPNDSGPDGQGGTVPFMSATGGRVSYVGYGRGYGLATFVNSPYGELVYGHAYPGSTRTRPGQEVMPGSVLGMIGTTGNSSAPHLHFGFPGGSFGAAMNVLTGAATVAAGDVAEAAGRSIPGFIKDLLLHPIDTIKGWATSTFSKASDFITDSPVWDVVKNVPGNLISGFRDKAWDMVPGWAKDAVGVARNIGEGIKDTVGAIGSGLDAITPGDGIPGVGGYAEGGILPYNGTMMYDNGGYLPPGLTTVVNLTGKPEPVFTDGQWAEMSGGAGGGSIHYEPHFEGSNLTAEDVAGDMNFTFRRLRRGGKYQEVGS